MTHYKMYRKKSRMKITRSRPPLYEEKQIQPQIVVKNVSKAYKVYIRENGVINGVKSFLGEGTSTYKR